jgi:drug/metabolite transporter (DMT)-like permease
MKNQHKAYLFASLTVLFWSTVATAFKIALRDLNTIQVLLISNFTSVLVFALLLALQGKMQLLKGTTLRGLGLSALQGLLNPFAYYLFIFKSYSLLPAQVAQPANFIWPIVLLLLSAPFLKQPLKLTGIAALLISFAGVLILSSQGNLRIFRIVEPVGVGLALFSSVVWSFYWIVNLKDDRDDLVKLFLGFFFAAFYILILAAATGNLSAFTAKSMLAPLYIGIFEMGITFAFWLKALQFSDSTGRVAGFVYLTPFISLVFIHFILHEKVYCTSVIGLCLVVGGILVSRIKMNAR